MQINIWKIENVHKVLTDRFASKLISTNTWLQKPNNLYFTPPTSLEASFTNRVFTRLILQTPVRAISEAPEVAVYS